MVGPPSQFETVLDLCRDKHRRIVLAVLADQQRGLTVSDLTNAIVKHNHHTPLTAASGETVTRISTMLHHVHVPKLEAAGLVEYDAERQIVTPTDEFEQVEPHLSAVIDTDPDLARPLEL